ncbi:Hypothetical protein CINCED_3A019087 [Cinara cedri]|uniref:Follicle cell protein 3C-1 n=1 Tax=Cinara cedri TaxID=506608 RepID=A0A5E4MYH4_9HEMI|nr:Hypothetical protein CINCED_3A019087 [Cinara cedri]
MAVVFAVRLFAVVAALGSLSPCVADRSSSSSSSSSSTSDVGNVPQKAAAHIAPQKFNELLGQGAPTSKTPCMCGVFLSSQIGKGADKQSQPTGYAALVHEHDDPVPCNKLGAKNNNYCANKCLEIIVKHLPNSAAIICGSVDRDVYKERAHLFVKNCSDSWTNTLLSGGKEYCCRDGQYYKCPKI